MPIFGKKDKQGNLSVNLMSVDGIPQIPQGMAIRLTLDDNNNRLIIELRIGNKPPVYLDYNQIVNAGLVTDRDVIEKNKSVIGRAAIGGLLIGPLGAIIGGISGTGNKKTTIGKNYIVINYRPSQSPDDIKAISFEIVGASLHWDSFLKALKTKFAQNLVSESNYL